MTLSLVGYISGLASTATPITINLPGGTVAGDLVVGSGIADISQSATPTGFTLLDGPTASDSQEIRGFSYVLTSTDIALGFVTMPGDAAFNGIRYALWVCHSTNGTPTVDGHAARQASDLTNPTVCDSGTITTASDGDLICVNLGSRVGSPTVWSATPGSVTTDQNDAGGYHHVFNYHYTQGSHGTTSAQSATIDSVNGREVAFLVGVADVGGGGAGTPVYYLTQAARIVTPWR